MEHTNTDTTESEIIDGWVKTTETIITWQEQPDQIADLLAENEQLGASLQVAEDQQESIEQKIASNSQKLADLGYASE